MDLTKATGRLTLKTQLDAKGIRYPLDVTTPELEKLIAAIPATKPARAKP